MRKKVEPFILLDFGPSLAEYRAELARLPGISVEQARRAAKRFSAELKLASLPGISAQEARRLAVMVTGPVISAGEAQRMAKRLLAELDEEASHGRS